MAQVHSRHLIHRDIKPANFVMGTDTSELCYCIDFGLSKRFRNPHTLAHIPHRVGKSLTGTQVLFDNLYFCSILNDGSHSV